MALHAAGAHVRAAAGIVLVVVLAGLAGCGSTPTGAGEVGGVVSVEEGIASYYGDRYHGRTTASGEIFDQEALTAAHRTLAFGTRVRVTHRGHGRQVVVRINDRGPFVDGRIIDLSKRAARDLGILEAGLAEVTVEVLPGN